MGGANELILNFVLSFVYIRQTLGFAIGSDNCILCCIFDAHFLSFPLLCFYYFTLSFCKTCGS